MKELIWKRIAKVDAPGFFITADIIEEGMDEPVGLEIFITEKLLQIKKGVNGRKFVYCEDGWRIYLTFFPTNQVVDERYALKNKVFKQANK